MPVVGHAFAGLATAMQFGPASVHDRRQPTSIASACWAPAVVVASYFPDIVTQVGGAVGVSHANAYGHSLAVGVVAGAALGGIWSAAAGTPLTRAVVIAIGSILGHDMLDALQAMGWPWSGRLVQGRPFGLSPRIASEAIWSALLFAMFLALRICTGRSIGIDVPPTFTRSSVTRWMPHAIVATERSITLSLSADEFLALLSENVELAEGIFRMLIATRGFGEGHTLVHGTLPPDLKDSAHLGGVDRALLLQSSPLLAHATAAQIWRLSAIAREKTIAAGADAIARGGDPAIIVVLSGGLTVEGHGQSGTATAGDIVGLYETLAGSRFDAAVTAKTEAKILRIDRAGLFELLADHTDLLQGVFSILLRTASAPSPLRRDRSGTVISKTVSTP